MTTPAKDAGLTVLTSSSNKQGNGEKQPREKGSFPPAFYSTQTGLLMIDPVVNSEGESLDKSDLAKDADINAYFPNRALQSIIQHHRALEEDTLRGSLRRMDSKVRAGLSHAVASSAFRGMHKPLAAEYYCPILCELMSDPVITCEGVTYEREAIEKWIGQHGTSPMTRQPLSLPDDVRPNWAIYDLMEWQQGHGEASIHPSVHRWKATKKNSNVQRPQQGGNHVTGSHEEEEREEVGCLACLFYSIILIPLAVVTVLFYILYGIVIVFLTICCCLCDEEEEN